MTRLRVQPLVIQGDRRLALRNVVLGDQLQEGDQRVRQVVAREARSRRVEDLEAELPVEALERRVAAGRQRNRVDVDEDPVEIEVEILPVVPEELIEPEVVEEAAAKPEEGT